MQSLRLGRIWFASSCHSSSPASFADQRSVCADVLHIACARPRLLSLHSVRAQAALLDLLESNMVSGAVLHWWTGSDRQTARAADLGCWFSVGPALARRGDRLARFPRSRVLTETDAPVGNAVAGRVDEVEAALAAVWNCDIEDVRQQVWRNFAAIVAATDTSALLPATLQKLIAEVRAR